MREKDGGAVCEKSCARKSARMCFRIVLGTCSFKKNTVREQLSLRIVSRPNRVAVVFANFVSSKNVPAIGVREPLNSELKKPSSHKSVRIVLSQTGRNNDEIEPHEQSHTFRSMEHTKVVRARGLLPLLSDTGDAGQ